MRSRAFAQKLGVFLWPLLFGTTMVPAACLESGDGAPVNGQTDASPPDADAGPSVMPTAQKSILALYEKYQVVGIGSPAHRNKDLDDFIMSLVREPEFPSRINDIIVECGNSLYQPLLDRYVAGEDVSFAEVRQVWRNTGQPSCPVSIFYEELVPVIRVINRKLPAEKRMRMLAADPPVDWTRIQSAEDLAKFEDRDSNIALVMKNEVLAKRRKALMLFGVIHLLHGAEGLAVGSYEKEYPNVTYVIAEHRGFGNHTPLAKDNDALEAKLAHLPMPSLVSIKGSWLAELDPKYIFP